MSIIEKIKERKEEFENNISNSENEKEETKLGVNVGNSATNVVKKEVLREIQNNTLKDLKDYLSMTFGPMGSNTKIITGNNKETITSSYSKDGLKVLKNISNSGPIEMSIISEIVDITTHVEKEVGDGTTSTVILSSLIFEKLMKIQEKYKIPPFQLIKRFENVVSILKENIKASGKECSIDDIFDISMISTNGNVEVSTNIKNIYEKYGMDVDLSVGISNTSESVLKVYDGLTITEGMSDPVYINNRENGTSEIRNAKIYHFADPIDNMEMISLFEAIINHNIYDSYEENETYIPTVITCPRISRDMSASLKMLAQSLYQFDNNKVESAKPPVLIITNVVASDEIIMDDIATLCGCRTIRKYIDPVMCKKDQESGNAPTLENVWEFCGEAECVVADNKKTKFINPKHMRVYDEEGNCTDDPIYTSMINFLETEIKTEKSSASAHDIGLLKKRLSALKANLVEYLVGGVTISERDAIKDLVEDAIKNCNSASLYGVGRAANFEGLYAAYNAMDNEDFDNIDSDIVKCIFFAYYEITEILYGTVCTDQDKITNYIAFSLENGNPYDISSGELPEENTNKVKCSIMLDINILDTLSKIITMMATCNQCLLQAPHLNMYK